MNKSHEAPMRRLVIFAPILALALGLSLMGLGADKALADDGLQAAQISAGSHPIQTADVNVTKKSNTQMTMTMSGGDKASVSTNGVGNKETWKSANPKVAKVKSTGDYTAQIVGVAPGKTTITATNNAGTLKITVTVTGTLSKTSLKMSPFSTAKLTFKGLKGRTPKKWASSNSNVKVDKNGKLTPMADGKALITCTDNKNCKYYCVVTVTRPNMNCKITKSFKKSGGNARRFALANKSGKTIVLNTNALHYASMDALKSGKFSVFYTQLTTNPRTLANGQSTTFDGVGSANPKTTKSNYIAIGFKVGKANYAAYFTPTTGKIAACVRIAKK